MNNYAYSYNPYFYSNVGTNNTQQIQQQHLKQQTPQSQQSYMANPYGDPTFQPVYMQMWNDNNPEPRYENPYNFGSAMNSNLPYDNMNDDKSNVVESYPQNIGDSTYASMMRMNSEPELNLSDPIPTPINNPAPISSPEPVQPPHSVDENLYNPVQDQERDIVQELGFDSEDPPITREPIPPEPYRSDSSDSKPITEFSPPASQSEDSFVNMPVQEQQQTPQLLDEISQMLEEDDNSEQLTEIPELSETIDPQPSPAVPEENPTPQNTNLQEAVLVEEQPAPQEIPTRNASADTQAMQELQTQIILLQKEISNLKNSLATQEKSHNVQVATIKGSSQAIIQNLQDKISVNQVQYEKEREEMQSNMRASEENYNRQIQELQDASKQREAELLAQLQNNEEKFTQEKSDIESKIAKLEEDHSKEKVELMNKAALFEQLYNAQLEEMQTKGDISTAEINQLQEKLQSSSKASQEEIAKCRAIIEKQDIQIKQLIKSLNDQKMAPKSDKPVRDLSRFKQGRVGGLRLTLGTMIDSKRMALETKFQSRVFIDKESGVIVLQNVDATLTNEEGSYQVTFLECEGTIKQAAAVNSPQNSPKPVPAQQQQPVPTSPYSSQQKQLPQQKPLDHYSQQQMNKQNYPQQPVSPDPYNSQQKQMAKPPQQPMNYPQQPVSPDPYSSNQKPMTKPPQQPMNYPQQPGSPDPYNSQQKSMTKPPQQPMNYPQQNVSPDPYSSNQKPMTKQPQQPMNYPQQNVSPDPYSSPQKPSYPVTDPYASQPLNKQSYPVTDPYASQPLNKQNYPQQPNYSPQKGNQQQNFNSQQMSKPPQQNYPQQPNYSPQKGNQQPPMSNDPYGSQQRNFQYNPNQQKLPMTNDPYANPYNPNYRPLSPISAPQNQPQQGGNPYPQGQNFQSQGTPSYFNPPSQYNPYQNKPGNQSQYGIYDQNNNPY